MRKYFLHYKGTYVVVIKLWVVRKEAGGDWKCDSSRAKHGPENVNLTDNDTKMRREWLYHSHNI
jgi:hypothetical protein